MVLLAAGFGSSEVREGDLSLHELVVKDVQGSTATVLGVGAHDDARVRLLDLRLGPTEVVPLSQLFLGLVQGIVHLCPIELADDVE